MDAKTLGEILNFLVGSVVTIVNPQSYSRTLTGYKIDTEPYKAKVISYEDRTLKILIEYEKDPAKKILEKAYQLIPYEQITRVSVSPTERFIML